VLEFPFLEKRFMSNTPSISEPLISEPSISEIARTIDHALLHPTMTEAQIVEGCQLALRLNLASVCVKPYAIPIAAKVLAGSAVGVGTVIGFPHGSHPTAVKAFEAQWACDQGAVELDMVVNVGKVIQGDWEYVRNDIRAVQDVAKANNAILKVIFETDFVTELADKQKLCEICDQLIVDFVKTSTGFGFTKSGSGYNYVGATEEDVALMRKVCRPAVGVKASGGIRNRTDALKFIALGCTRLGTSASEAILKSDQTDVKSY